MGGLRGPYFYNMSFRFSRAVFAEGVVRYGNGEQHIAQST